MSNLIYKTSMRGYQKTNNMIELSMHHVDFMLIKSTIYSNLYHSLMNAPTTFYLGVHLLNQRSQLQEKN